MTRFPKGEQLERIVAAGLAVAGELQVPSVTRWGPTRRRRARR